MGYYTASNKTKTFRPDNTKDKIYIEGSMRYTFSELFDIASEHFEKDYNLLDNIAISAEHIQTRCIGYDIYDPDDYDDFIVMERLK